MVELNGCEPKKVKVLGPYTFSIGDTTGYSEYIRGGVATQVKMPKTISFKSYTDALANPEFVMTDYGKFDHPQTLHVAFEALYVYIEKNSRLPRPWNNDDAQEFLGIAKQLSTEELKEDLLLTFAKVCIFYNGVNFNYRYEKFNCKLNLKIIFFLIKTSAGELNPINAIFGGIIGQEVMKACSGKFGPILQFLYYDAIECIPEETPTEEDAQPLGTRYDSQIAVFGKKFQDKIGKLR